MKMIAYSEVPAKVSYIHLGYISAARENQQRSKFYLGLFILIYSIIVAVAVTGVILYFRRKRKDRQK